MKSITKIILIFLSVIAFVACEKDDEDFSPKDSYLYVWNVRTWEVDTESKLSDIKVTYFFKGDTYNPQIQISEKSQTKRLKIADSRKTKRPIIDKRTTPNKRHSNAIITL